nr:uncharacterized protein LOC129532082 [Gorilla gorilla gorilla]
MARAARIGEGTGNRTLPPSSPAWPSSGFPVRQPAGKAGRRSGVRHRRGTKQELQPGARALACGAARPHPAAGPASPSSHVHWAAETSSLAARCSQRFSLPHPRQPRPRFPPPLPRFPAGPEEPGPEVSGQEVAASPPWSGLREGAGAGAGGGSREEGRRGRGPPGARVTPAQPASSDSPARLAVSTRAEALILGGGRLHPGWRNWVLLPAGPSRVRIYLRIVDMMCERNV